MPSLNEVAAYLTGIVKMVRNDAGGLQYLDLSMRGFWQSFFAFAYSLPAYACFWISERSELLSSDPTAELGAGFFVKAAFTDALGVVLALVAVAIAARPLGMSDRFVQWVISGNWLSLPLSYAMAVATLLTFGASGPEGAAGPFLLIAVLAALVITWRVYRVALEDDGLLAFGLLMITELVFIVVQVALG